MKKETRLAKLVNTVLAPEHKIIGRHHINARAGGIKHPVYQRILRKCSVIGVSHIAKYFCINGKGHTGQGGQPATANIKTI